MKLLFCSRCGDILKLQFRVRWCNCGFSWGRYDIDGHNAVVGGGAVPLGVLNGSIAEAIRQRPLSGDGSRFEAFVIPTKCPTVREER